MMTLGNVGFWPLVVCATEERAWGLKVWRHALLGRTADVYNIVGKFSYSITMRVQP